MLVPDTAELVFLFEGVPGGGVEGCEAQFTLYVRDTITAWDAGQLTQLAQFGVDWFNAGKNGGTALKTAFNPAWRLIACRTKDLSINGGVPVTVASGVVGTQAGDVVAPNCAVQITFALDAGGEPTRGWVFLPAGSESSLNGNNWSTGFVDAIVGMFNDFNQALSVPPDGDVNWAVVRVSRSSGTQIDPTPRRIPTPRATAVTNTLAAVLPRYEVASQRDRRSSQ